MTNENPVITTDEARKAAEDYRRAELDLQQLESSIKARKAAIDAEYEETIADLTLIQNNSREVIAAYAESKREELLSGGKKSAGLYGLTVGWKLTPPAVQLRRAKDTWDKVLARLKEQHNGQYVTVKESVDKSALKKATPDLLSSIGVELAQEERFEIKL